MRIVLTAYDRPEFLAETIRTLNNAQRYIDDMEGWVVPVDVYVDKHDDSAITNEVFKMCEEIDHVSVVHMRPEKFGGSRNNAMAILESSSIDEHIVYLESDVIVSLGFLSWVKEMRDALGDSNCMQLSAGHPDIIRDYNGCVINQWPSSIGVMFNMSNMDFFRRNLDRFLGDPNGVALSHRHEVPTHLRSLMFDGDSYFNHAWGGLLALNMAITNTFVIHSSPPRACHIGWHGWHLNKNLQEAKGITCPEDHAQYAKNFSESTK